MKCPVFAIVMSIGASLLMLAPTTNAVPAKKLARKLKGGSSGSGPSGKGKGSSSADYATCEDYYAALAVPPASASGKGSGSSHSFKSSGKGKGSTSCDEEAVVACGDTVRPSDGHCGLLVGLLAAHRDCVLSSFDWLIRLPMLRL